MCLYAHELHRQLKVNIKANSGLQMETKTATFFCSTTGQIFILYHYLSQVLFNIDINYLISLYLCFM